MNLLFLLNDEDFEVKEKAMLRISQSIDVNWTYFDNQTI
jgi:hypothetical protein